MYYFQVYDNQILYIKLGHLKGRIGDWVRKKGKIRLGHLKCA